MRRVDEPLLRLTHALRREDTAVAAAQALGICEQPAAVEGLLELRDNPPSARAALAAVNALQEGDGLLARDALRQALHSVYGPVRQAAAEALQCRPVSWADEDLLLLVRTDPSWPVRRAALRALAETGTRWDILSAADDPHWRVRHALVKVLLDWSKNDAIRQEIDERLARLPANQHVAGVRAYLAYRGRGGQENPTGDAVTRSPVPARPPFWDDDVAVLVRNLEQLGPSGR